MTQSTNGKDCTKGQGMYQKKEIQAKHLREMRFTMVYPEQRGVLEQSRSYKDGQGAHRTQTTLMNVSFPPFNSTWVSSLGNVLPTSAELLFLVNCLEMPSHTHTEIGFTYLPGAPQTIKLIVKIHHHTEPRFTACQHTVLMNEVLKN